MKRPSAKPSTSSASTFVQRVRLRPSSPAEEKLLRRLWRANRNLVRSWERLERLAKTVLETYGQARDIVAYHVPHCRAEMRDIEKVLPDLLDESNSPARGRVRKPSTS